MKKLAVDYTPPVFTFHLAQQINKKELDFAYGYDTLGGEVSFTS